MTTDTDKPIEKRGPGRPPRKQEVKQRRRRRTEMGVSRHDPLAIPEKAKDKNFVYRFINDVPGRVQSLTQLDDYDVVTEEELNARLAGEDFVESSEGTPVVRKTRGFDGGEMDVYLVKKPKDYYEADKAEEQEAIAQVEKAAEEEGITPGKDGLTAADNAYVPKGHRNRLG